MEVLNLENTKEDRKRLDIAIRKAINAAETDHCPEVWKKIKPILESPQETEKLLGKVRENI
jgi:ribosome maturation factor RimP